MDAGDLKGTISNEVLESRARYFLAAGPFRTRIPADLQQRPDRLTADLAWIVMAGLCASKVTGAPLDIERAVSSGREMFEELMSTVTEVPDLAEGPESPEEGR